MAQQVKNSPVMHKTQEMQIPSLAWKDPLEEGKGHGSPLQYSCLENPKDRGVWRATVQRVTKSWAHTHIAYLIV